MFNLARSFLRQSRSGGRGMNGLRLFRFFGPWRESLKMGSSPIESRRPWLTFQAINVLGKHVKTGSRVFEYGGGGSTFYFLDRGASVVTVEHDPEWLALVEDKIAADGLAERWTGVLKQPATAPDGWRAASLRSGRVCVERHEVRGCLVQRITRGRSMTTQRDTSTSSLSTAAAGRPASNTRPAR